MNGRSVHEARMAASFVGDPRQLTFAQMDRWCKDFDNWVPHIGLGPGR